MKRKTLIKRLSAAALAIGLFTGAILLDPFAAGDGRVFAGYTELLQKRTSRSGRKGNSYSNDPAKPWRAEYNAGIFGRIYRGFFGTGAAGKGY